MASNQKLNATITIGGAIQASFKNALGSTASQIGQVGRSIRDLTDRQRRLQNAAGHWEKMGRDASRFHNELERVNRELQRQQRIRSTLRAQEQNQGRRDALRGQLFDAVALGATLAAPVRTAMNFEQAMAKVGAVSNASAEDLGKLTQTARQLGATTNWSASQAAEGMQFLAMAGFSTEQTMAAMPGMLNLASAGAIELGQAADIASNILSGFNLEANEMGRLGDVLTNTFTTSNTSLSGLGETMKYVAPIAAATGVSLEQAAAMAGKLGDAGIQGSNAGTALRAVISRLAAPTGQAADMLEQLGIQTTDASGNLREVPDILADLNKSMASMGTAAKANITSTIFGLEAASAATVLLGKAGDGSLQDYATRLEETGSAARVAQKQNETATGAMKRLGSAVESIGITIGNVLLPVLADGADMVAKVVGVVDTLAQEFPLLTKVVVGGTSALIALKVAAIAGGYAFTFLKGAWLSASLMGLRLGGALPMIATGIRAVGVALAANPIGLIVTGIALAAGVLIANWDSVGPWFASLWETVSGYFQVAWDHIKGLLSWTPLGLVVANWGTLTDWFSGLWSGIVDSAKAAFNWIAGKLEWVGKAAARVKSFFGFGDDEEEQQAVRVGAAVDNEPPDIMADYDRSMPATAAARGEPSSQASPQVTNNVTSPTTINIYQQPGQDTRQLAEEIERVRQENERAALYDAAGAY